MYVSYAPRRIRYGPDVSLLSIQVLGFIRISRSSILLRVGKTYAVDRSGEWVGVSGQCCHGAVWNLTMSCVVVLESS